MDDERERTETIVKLERLEYQVREAISYLQNNPLYLFERHFKDPNESPNMFKIGDFTITSRFTEPH